MKIHFIAIGGAAMHNLAIALKNNGHHITGSDDEVYEPSKSRLREHGLLPEKMGWDSDRITTDLDLVILGMHALKDNPELNRAKELGVTINSYPEFIYNQSKNKKRIVIAGSHGKTTTTAMVLHVLQSLHYKFDYMVGARIRGFDNMVHLTKADTIILEGDEYFTSPIDPKAKFLWYKPHIAVITGIAWDHINVYPTKDSYNKAFADFIESMEAGGQLFYYEGDNVLTSIAEASRPDIKKTGYAGFDYKVEDGETIALTAGNAYELKVFGQHNIQNMQAARLICNALGVKDHKFFHAISKFEGAANRLEFIAEAHGKMVYKDFAHSPSKLKATVKACSHQFPDKRLLAVMELHTYSSLNKEFLKEYKQCLDDADHAIVYISHEVLEHKKLPAISVEEVKEAFGNDELIVVTNSHDLEKQVRQEAEHSGVILLMSSGNFGGIDVKSFARELIGQND